MFGGLSCAVCVFSGIVSAGQGGYGAAMKTRAPDLTPDDSAEPALDKADVVRFRPHHFLCAIGFEGKGYSGEFTENMAAIVLDRLRAKGGEATPMRVVGQTDDICAPCPKRRGRLCTNQQGISRLDRAHALALKFEPHEELTWGDALARIRENVMPGDLSKLCGSCRWLDYGMCEAALQRLHDGALD